MGGDPYPLEDDDRVQQERHRTNPTDVRKLAGLSDELREEEIAEQHARREDESQREGERWGVRIDPFDERLHHAVGDEQPSDLDEAKLQVFGLLEISPHGRLISERR